MVEPVFRRAVIADLGSIVGMLADDPLGSGRESMSDPLDPRYLRAFEAIDRDPNQFMMVAEDDGRVVGCAQLTLIPGLSRTGMLRGQIEGVRVAASHRGAGTGRRMLEALIDKCRSAGCGLVQLTSDETRPDAIRFYESLGFVASHRGMKLALASPPAARAT